MKTQKTHTKWIIDSILFAGFIFAVFLDLTGLGLHQWLGVAISTLALYHLITHWDWVKAVTQRFLGRTSANARLYYLVDTGLGMGFSLILVTGLVISTWLSFSLSNYAVWKNVHIFASITTLVLIVLKIGIHWRWIVQVAQRSIFVTRVISQEKRSVQPAEALLSTGRRDFLKLMGVVGGVSFLALGSALDGMEGISGSEVISSQQTIVQDSLSSTIQQNSSTNLSSVSACRVACSRACSYPGHCHRYVDTNANQHCDFGECA